MSDLTTCPRENCTATYRHWHIHTGFLAATGLVAGRPQADLTEPVGPPLAFEAYTLANFFGVPVGAVAAPNYKEETTMKKSEALATALAAALAEEARIEEKYGTDHEDGTVIAFRVQFMAGGIWYEYAAIRVSGAWCTTRSPKAYTWEELTGWLDGAHRVSKIKTLRKGRKSKKET